MPYAEFGKYKVSWESELQVTITGPFQAGKMTLGEADAEELVDALSSFLDGFGIWYVDDDEEDYQAGE